MVDGGWRMLSGCRPADLADLAHPADLVDLLRLICSYIYIHSYIR